jgi:hypothetical protein
VLERPVGQWRGLFQPSYQTASGRPQQPGNNGLLAEVTQLGTVTNVYIWTYTEDHFSLFGQ